MIIKNKHQFQAIELVFTRPFSLFIVEYWRDPLLIKNLKKDLGIPMKDQIAFYNGRTILFYRLASDMEKLKKDIIKIPPNHKVHSIAACEKYRKFVIALKLLIKQRFTDQQLWSSYKQGLFYFEKLYSWYLIGVFLPGQWAADYESIYERAGARIIQRHYKNRYLSEGLLGEFSILINRIAKQRLDKLGVSIDPSLLRRLEIEKLLKSNIKPPKEAIKRQAGYVNIGGKLLINTQFNKILREKGYFYKILSGKKNIAGTVAYQAKPVVGRARLIFSAKDVIKFKQGEVLVSPMTQLDFTPAMKKAAAIITDEGSITCHAAIVARELGIPCVIGTKVATKVFKDGDRVEVDATKGIVKKI